MSVFRFRSSPPKEKNEEKHEAEVEEIHSDQPHNPYTEILILQQHVDIVRLLVPIDNGHQFISAGDDNKAIVWDTETGRSLVQLCGHSLPITCILVMPDDFVLTGSSDKSIRVWELETGFCRHILTAVNTSIRCLVSLPQDGLFCSGGQELALWSLQPLPKPLNIFQRGDDDDITQMIVIKNDHLVTASDKKLVVCGVVSDMCDPSLKEIIVVKKLPSHREAISSLIVVSEVMFASGSIDGQIILWTSHNLHPARILNVIMAYQGASKLYPYSVQSMVCLEQHYLIAAIGAGFGVFDLTERQERLVIRKLAAHYSRIMHLELVCSGFLLATCSEDGSIRLWGWPSDSAAEKTEKEELELGPMERFTGLSTDQLKKIPSETPLEPLLLGECLAHSGSVQTFLDLGDEGLVSCGADGLVIMWKNSEYQKVKRNRLVHDIVRNENKVI